MEMRMMTVIGVLLLGSLASAKTVCAVSKESAPGQFDQTLMSTILEDVDQEVLVYTDGKATSIYANVGRSDGSISLAFANPTDSTWGPATSGAGSPVILIDARRGLSVSCARVPSK